MNDQYLFSLKKHLIRLSRDLDGELLYDELVKRLYATDASVYRIIPLAVAFPKHSDDLKKLILFAQQYSCSLIPRTAGTSLAGQCVGEGIVVDFSKYFTDIISFDKEKALVTVQPGVVRDQLNNFLKPHQLFFGPNTSTSNRCMMGGMVGNNSSGTTSIKYGVTRDKIVSVKALLSDGSEVNFEELNNDTLNQKLKKDDLEAAIYKTLYKRLSDPSIQNAIVENYPKPSIHRRNTGYALDVLLQSTAFENIGQAFNISKLICGSEGTLALVTEITLLLDSLPPEHSALIAAHFDSIESCLNAVQPAMNHDLFQCEMMDDTILDLTKHNKSQAANRSFIQGHPKALLMCELRSDSIEDLNEQVERLNKTFKDTGLAYCYPVLYGDDIVKAVELRKAGLGLLGNMIGDKKAVACIEDTAVALEDLSDYIAEFTSLMNSYNQNAVYYAHAGAGELHLRPILNLKHGEDVSLFRSITSDVARLVKKYKGSLSGEHGDGIVRSEFIPLMLGKTNFELIEEVKSVFDPSNIFNPGKITEPRPMDKNLRYEIDRKEPQPTSFLNFENTMGILREAEKCNGSGDCRKLPEFGGTMCPSYRATKNEKDSTRARANALREFLTHSNEENKYDHEELKEVFDLCLSCKACSSECPSSVDVAALKAEFQYQYQRSNGISLRTKAFAFNTALNKRLIPFSGIVNWTYKNGATSYLLKKILGIAPRRSFPNLSNESLSNWFQKYNNEYIGDNPIKTVYLFIDEFTNYLDTDIGKDAIVLLTRLNYKIAYLPHEESGRAMISQGLLKEAKKVVDKNVDLFKDKISEKTPLIGIEPSAILGFKDDYLRLATDLDAAKNIADHCYLIEEFIQNEIKAGHIKAHQFTEEKKTIKFHGHCHQKALINQKCSFDALNLPKNYRVTLIPSGCCGMAGSFGYEKEKYNISMTIGGHTLFPAVNKASKDTIIVANGTSCRHQILDGTGRAAKHPVTILKEALI